MSASVIAIHMSLRQWGLLLFLSVLWGMSYIFMELAIRDLPTFSIVFGRLFFAAVMLFSYIKVMGRKLSFSLQIWRMLFIASIIGMVIPFSLIVWGQHYVTASLSSVLNGTVPIFTVILTHFMTVDERMKLNKLMGVVAGFVGVAVIMGLDISELDTQGLVGQLAVLAGAACYAWATVYRRRFAAMGVRPLSAATGEMIIACFAMLPIVLFFEPPWAIDMPSLTSLWAVIGLGVFSTGLAFVMYHTLIPQIGAGNMSLVTFLIPISAILLGIVFLEESLSWNQLLGMGFIGLGLLVIDGRLLPVFKAA